MNLKATTIYRAFLSITTTLLLAIVVIPFQASAQPTVSNASDSQLDEKKALEMSQAAIGRKVHDYTFRDTTGKRVKLSDFYGKPVVISLIYSSCADVCPVITSTLLDADEIARDAVGDDAYTILTIGFDTGEDNPVRMKSFASNQGVEISDHWKFLSGDIAAIAGLSDDLGFQFFESTKGFDHLTQTSVLDRNGAVYRQIYGETFAAPHLVEPLKNLTFGTDTPFASLGDLLNKVRLFCTIYDPTADKYRFEYSIFFRMFVGGMIIMGMVVFLLNWVREDRKRKKQLSKIESETI